jgi:hypothetical protein
MPDEYRHRTQASHNRAFATILCAQTSYADWALVAYFYSALHMMDALIARFTKRHPKNYKERDTLINKLPMIPQEVVNAYHDLLDASQDARYECVRRTVEEVKDDYLPLLDTIARFVHQKLGPINT